MHRHTRCMGVAGVMLFQGVSSCPRGAGCLIHQRDSMGDLPRFAHGGEPLPYCLPVTHPPTKVTLKLT